MTDLSARLGPGGWVPTILDDLPLNDSCVHNDIFGPVFSAREGPGDRERGKGLKALRSYCRVKGIVAKV